MRFALTTFDNPYDPFEQFTQWFMFDEEKGYHTTAYLGRIARTSDQLSDEEDNSFRFPEHLSKGYTKIRNKRKSFLKMNFIGKQKPKTVTR